MTPGICSLRCSTCELTLGELSLVYMIHAMGGKQMTLQAQKGIRWQKEPQAEFPITGFRHPRVHERLPLE